MNDQIVTALTSSFHLLGPEIVLGFTACILFVGGAFRPNRHVWAVVALAGLFGALGMWWFTPSPVAFYKAMPDEISRQAAVYSAPLYWDQLASLVKIIALGGGVVLVLFGWDEVPDRHAAEFHACLLLIVAGLCLTGLANELITLFLALELISIPTYVLLYLPRHDNLAQEAAMKYFLLSIFSSALLLFGFSYLYGLAGTTNLPALTEALQGSDRDSLGRLEAVKFPAVIALVMVVAGFCFRITAVPFHFYAPDVYQGAPTSGAALLAFLPKVAGFVGLMRVLGFALGGRAGNGIALSDWVPILLWILAAVTMTLGNILALLQNNLKRLLAYSSVAHAGYMLIGLSVAFRVHGSGGVDPSFPGGIEAVLFYLVAYAAMTVGAFAVLAHLSTSQKSVEMEDDLIGLSRSHPGVALLMAIFLFSLIGIPWTAGFWGKLFLFFGAMGIGGDRGQLFRVLALIGAVNAAIGAWYYLRILAKMYLHTPIKPLEKPRPGPALAAVCICALLTIGLGIPPGLGYLQKEAGRASMAHAEQSLHPGETRELAPMGLGGPVLGP